MRCAQGWKPIMNRRELLLSSAGLLLGSQWAEGQGSVSASSTGDVVFADFETGVYDGWTLEGNCWTPAPATNETFGGRISGFQGRYFLCTLHPRLGTAATGKAVSKEFIIEKPFVNFLIGGGNYPGEACLNLVVDGKVVRTVTGDDTAQLRPESWDVSLLIGKKAHFEVVDATRVPERGYIMVDNLRCASRPTDLSQLNYEDGPPLGHFGLRKRFVESCSTRFTPPFGDWEFGPLFDFGITPAVHRRLIDATCCQVYRYLHDPARPIERTAAELRDIVDRQMAQNGVATPSAFLRLWMYAEAVCAYVTASVHYDHQIVDQTLGKGEALERERWRRQAVEIVYGTSRPLATCDGFSRLTQRLAALCGVPGYHIDGTARSWKSPADSPNHGWIVFDIAGVRVPADTTSDILIFNKPLTRLSRKIRSTNVLPITTRDWETFLASHYENNVVSGEKRPPDLSLNACSFDEWKSLTQTPLWPRYEALFYELQKRDEDLVRG
jgi:hypothetical protein